MENLKKIYDQLTYLRWDLQKQFDEFVFMNKIEPEIDKVRNMVQGMMNEMDGSYN